MELYDRLSRARELLEKRRKVVSESETFVKSLSDAPLTVASLNAALGRQRAAVAESEAIVRELEKASGVLPLKGGK